MDYNNDVSISSKTIVLRYSISSHQKNSKYDKIFIVMKNCYIYKLFQSKRINIRFCVLTNYNMCLGYPEMYNLLSYCPFILI